MYMSVAALNPILDNLPFALKSQVSSYTESVRNSLPDIFHGAEIKYDWSIAEELLFVAGIRKLHSLISSSLWTLENSITLLSQNDISNIRVGGKEIGAKSEYQHNLRRLNTELEKTLGEYSLIGYLSGSYSEVLKNISIAREIR